MLSSRAPEPRDGDHDDDGGGGYLRYLSFLALSLRSAFMTREQQAAHSSSVFLRHSEYTVRNRLHSPHKKHEALRIKMKFYSTFIPFNP